MNRQEIIYRHIHPQEFTISRESTKNQDSVVTSELLDSGVVVIYLNNSPVNACSNELLSGLSENVERAFKNPKCKAIVLTSGLRKFFIAGADISVIQKLQGKPKELGDWCTKANEIVNRLETGPIPIVAAINGVSLGGGLEIPMACAARVCVPEATLGLPELKIGLIPGWGGTQRLPRLVGVKKALDMMLNSVNVNGKEAEKIGLVSKCVSLDQLIPTACELALEIANDKSKRIMTLFHYAKLESPEETKKIFANLKKPVLNAPHPQCCINSILAGVTENGVIGLQREYEEFMKCAPSKSAKALIHYFFAERAVTKVPELEGIAPKKISKVSIIGGGFMGSGIIVSCLLAGYSVILKEANEKFLADGMKRVTGILSKMVGKKLTQEKYDNVMKNFKGQTSYDGFDKLDLVVEAVYEDLKLKQQIFVELEKETSSECILASNTSTLDIEKIGEKTSCQDRILGLHFFSPAHVMKLLEIIKSSKMSKTTLATGAQFGKAIQKTVVIVGNCVGFVVNRVFYPLALGSSYLVNSGIHPHRIDAVIKKSQIIPNGPFILYDMVGIDVFYHVGRSISGEYKDLKYPINFLDNLYDLKRYGQKTSLGCYKYENGKAVPDKDVEALIKKAIQKPVSFTDEEILEILIFPCVNEACKVLQENLVIRASDIDIASCLGMGFGTHYGGLVQYGENIGAKKIHDRLVYYHQKSGNNFFAPCKYLIDRASKNASLYK